jgi:hypothetical protein
MLRVIEIQVLKLSTNYLIHARKDYMIYRSEALEDFNECCLFANISNGARGIGRS